LVVSADSLSWHDAGIDLVEEDPALRRMTWQVEVFRWDREEDGDAQPGCLVFEGVEAVEALHDLQGRFRSGEVDWEVLTDEFERREGQLRCEFRLQLGGVRNALGGPGYAELVVICRDAWFVPSHDDTP
jgi:hypothetical protein